MAYPAFPPPPSPFEHPAQPLIDDRADLSSLPLDELLERYALLRQAHRAQINYLNNAEKIAAQLRDRESAARQALLRIISSTAEW